MKSIVAIIMLGTTASGCAAPLPYSPPPMSVQIGYARDQCKALGFQGDVLAACASQRLQINQNQGEMLNERKIMAQQEWSRNMMQLGAQISEASRPVQPAYTVPVITPMLHCSQAAPWDNSLVCH